MKVLIVGLGSIARKHIIALKNSRKVEIYALRSSNKGFKEQGVTNLYSYEEVKEFDFDFIIVSNPTFKHRETILKLIDFGRPLFIEKPLFGNLQEEDIFLLEEIKTKNIKNYVACNLRFLDCLKEIKKVITHLRINEINIYGGSYLPSWRPDLDFRKIYSANEDMDGGVHIDLIHELDYLYWLFGEPLNVTSFFSKKSSLGINAIDYANYLWQFSDFNASIILNYYRKDAKRSMEIISEGGTYLVDLLENKIFLNGSEIFSSPQRVIDTYSAQMEFFLDYINNKGKGFNSVEEAYKILNLCLKE